MRVPEKLKWIGMAVLGILIAAAIAVAASRLASRQIGLASEPISAGDALAPQTTRPGRAADRRSQSRAPEATTSEPTTTTAAPEPTPTSPVPTPETPSRSESSGEDGGADHGGHEGGDD